MPIWNVFLCSIYFGTWVLRYVYIWIFLNSWYWVLPNRICAILYFCNILFLHLFDYLSPLFYLFSIIGFYVSCFEPSEMNTHASFFFYHFFFFVFKFSILIDFFFFYPVQSGIYICGFHIHGFNQLAWKVLGNTHFRKSQKNKTWFATCWVWHLIHINEVTCRHWYLLF